MSEQARVLADRYVLGERLGSGGNGAVYAASDQVLGREVAVKMLRADTDAEGRARLRSEAKVAAGLSHPGIAQVYDYGEIDEHGRSVPFVVMQRVHGATLHERLRTGPLNEVECRRLVGEVASALASAHARGVVHRDVKPSNIMVSSTGSAVLLDFGIAHVAGAESLTRTGTIIGTVDYLSPEQARGEQATPRSDVYALGMVAYEALTGSRALRRETEAATLLAHVTEDVPALPPSFGADLRDLVAAMVARTPQARPSDGDAVLARLESPATRVSDATEVLAPVTAPLPAVETVAMAPARRRRRPTGWQVVAGLGAMIVVLVAAALLWGGGGDDTPAAQAGSEPSAAPAKEPQRTPTDRARERQEPTGIEIPAEELIGHSEEDVTKWLERQGLEVEDEERPTDQAPPETVVDIVPSGAVQPGSTVTIVLATELEDEDWEDGEDWEGEEGPGHSEHHGKSEDKGRSDEGKEE